MNLKLPVSRLVERLNGENMEYILTVNNIICPCPHKAPIPHQDANGNMSFAFTACGSSCPLFTFLEKDGTVNIHMACGNNSCFHNIEEIIELPKVEEIEPKESSATIIKM